MVVDVHVVDDSGSRGAETVAALHLQPVAALQLLRAQSSRQRCASCSDRRSTSGAGGSPFMQCGT